MKKEIEVIGKILCEICGANTELLEVKIIERSESGNFVGRVNWCVECLAKEDNNEEEK